MIYPLRKLVVPLALLLGSLGSALGCAGSMPQGQASWGLASRPEGRQSAPAGGATKEVAKQLPGGVRGSNRTVSPAASGAVASSPAVAAAAPAARADKPAASAAAGSRGRSLNSAGTAVRPAGSTINLSDSPLPNPLRSGSAAQPPASGRQLAVTPPPQPGKPNAPFSVQTVGYQEEVPLAVGEPIPGGNGAMRLARLEEPTMAEPSSVLVANSPGVPTAAADPSAEAPELNAPTLPLETASQGPLEEILSDQPPTADGAIPILSNPNQSNPTGPAQGHYQQGSPVYGQLLNEPQQTASQRAVQLLDENERLREEMQDQLKKMESLQARLKQQDEMWIRARQEFLDVRSVVEKLTRENLLLKQQLEKSTSEKAELARQYQTLIQTVEQTLDDLLLRAMAQPSTAPPPLTLPTTQPEAPPVTQPAPQSTPQSVPPSAPQLAPPLAGGQQASTVKSSQ